MSAIYMTLLARNFKPNYNTALGYRLPLLATLIGPFLSGSLLKKASSKVINQQCLNLFSHTHIRSSSTDIFLTQRHVAASGSAEESRLSRCRWGREGRIREEEQCASTGQHNSQTNAAGTHSLYLHLQNYSYEMLQTAK